PIYLIFSTIEVKSKANNRSQPESSLGFAETLLSIAVLIDYAPLSCH
ncbi:unnamed protein product, partial [marine sediment metagenome]